MQLGFAVLMTEWIEALLEVESLRNVVLDVGVSRLPARLRCSIRQITLVQRRI